MVPMAWCGSRSEVMLARLDALSCRSRVGGPLTPVWSATSSARLYWEGFRTIFAAIASGEKPPELSLPVAFTVFPGEIFQAPRSWAEKVYPNLVYFNEADRGGHFAAWEEPELFATELRAASRPLRQQTATKGAGR